MANQVVNREVNIFIRSGEAQRALDALIKKEEQLKKALSTTESRKEMVALQREIDALQEPLERARMKVAGEINPSLRDLQTTATRVRQEFSRMSEGDDGFEEKRQQFLQVNKELDQSRQKLGIVKSAMSEFWKEARVVATGVVIGGAVQGIFDAVIGGLANMVTGSAELADEIADIEKTTGLTTEQVRRLNSEFKEFDTRTSNSKLRQYAEEAGKLGKEGVADIKKFVQEADIIDVALGKDLGESAILDIAKSATIYKEEMLNIASAINEVGANSEASEAFSVDFLKRLAGTAPTVGLAADQVLGYSAALEAAGQTAEVSTTALNTFFLDFVSNISAFEKAAGMAEGTLQGILQTEGTNEAFLTFLDNLKKAQPEAAGFIRSLKGLGIDGARGSNVMLALANNIDNVRKQQSIANEAIQDSSSVMEEFNKKNQNAAAEWDKFKKNFQGLFTSSTVTEGAASLIRTLNSLVNVLKAIPEFVDQNKIALLTLAAGIVLLNRQYIISAASAIKDAGAKVLNTAVTKASALATNIAGAAQAAYIVVTNLLTGTITRATAAQRLWNVAMSIGLGPLGVILTVVGLAVVAIGSLVNRTRQLTAEQKIQADIAKRVADATAETVNKVGILTEVVKDNNVSLDNRKKALQELIAISPEYLKGLTLENINTAEGKKILDDYNAALLRSAELKGKSALLDEQSKRRAEVLINLQKQGQAIKNFNSAFPGLADELATGNTGAASERFINFSNGPFRNQVKELLEINKSMKILSTDLTAAAKENVSSVTGTTNAVTGGAAAAVGLLEKLRAKLEGLRADREKATDEKTVQNLTREIEAVEAQIAALEGKGKKASGTLRSTKDDLAQLQEELRKLALSLMPEGFEKELTALEEKYGELRTKARGNNKLLLEIERLHQIEVQALRDKYYTQSVQVQESAAERQAALHERMLNAARAVVGRLQNNIVQGPIRLNRDRLAERELAVITSSGQKRLQAELELLKEQERQELLNKDLTEHEKLLIEERYRQKRKQLELSHFTELAQQVIEWAGQALQVLSVFDNAQTARENAELERDRRLNERKRQNLERRLKSGLVTQLGYDQELRKMEKEQEAREKAIRLKQFKRDQRMQVVQALMSGAQAVVSTLAARPGSLDIISLGAFRAINIGLAVAATAAQVGAIASRKPPEFGRGGRLSGPSHGDPSKGMPVINPYTGQIQAYLEGQEGIVNKRTMRDQRRFNVTGTASQIISLLNAQGGGVHWQSGAVLKPAWSTTRPVQVDYTRVNQSLGQVRRMYAAGGVYEGKSEAQAPGNAVSSEVLQVLTGTMAALNTLTAAIGHLQAHGVKAPVVLSELEAQRERLAAIRDDGTATLGK